MTWGPDDTAGTLAAALVLIGLPLFVRWSLPAWRKLWTSRR